MVPKCSFDLHPDVFQTSASTKLASMALSYLKSPRTLSWKFFMNFGCGRFHPRNAPATNTIMVNIYLLPNLAPSLGVEPSSHGLTDRPHTPCVTRIILISHAPQGPICHRDDNVVFETDETPDPLLFRHHYNTEPKHEYANAHF